MQGEGLMPSRTIPAGVASPPLSPTAPTCPPGRGAWLTGTGTGGRRGCRLPPSLAAGDTAFNPGHNKRAARGSALPQRPAPLPSARSPPPTEKGNRSPTAAAPGPERLQRPAQGVTRRVTRRVTRGSGQ